jgi:aryl-phospho-beta-D-glucosidase BglC (GH1 family)
LVVPATSWTELGNLPMKGIQLAQGEHVLRVSVTSGAVNIDWFAVIGAGQCLNGCAGRACGTDDCGKSCGTCAADETCTAKFECLDPAACAASCGDKECGLDDCGGSCGTCAGKLLCTPTGRCWDNSVTPVARHGQLSIDGTKIKDAHGKVAQLKGVSTQWLNWEQEYSTSRPAMKWLRDNWGLSLFRIANGVENQNGYLEDPDTRLALVRDIIDNAIANEVYVLVDWHTHEPEHLAEAKAFFAAIAQEYGDQPNIIYELFNEPLDLDWSKDLKPYHQAIIDVIRKDDPDNLIVVGTPRWDQLPNAAAADPIDDANVAYTLHFYACSHQANIRANGTAALAAGLPVFVSEWGATNADGGTSANPGVCEDSARQWQDWMEQNDISWAAWKLDAGGDSSSILATGAPVDGGWTDDQIHGHGYLVHEFMLDER